MNADPDRRRAQVVRPIAAIALDRRRARAVVATLVIGAYMALGFAFRLGAEAYLLLGIPITIAFQVVVVRRPTPVALAARGTTHQVHGAR